MDNVRVFTGDIAVFDLPEEDKATFDRIISIEMFEHMKNYGLLMKKLATWLVADGKLFGMRNATTVRCMGRCVCVSVTFFVASEQCTSFPIVMSRTTSRRVG